MAATGDEATLNKETGKSVQKSHPCNQGEADVG